ncbi:MAG: hypothetical protein H0U95_18740 [Bacteroidetes bacterium]|nr:hypothetical protein [Bacteroidota bacterium]
MRTIFYVLIFLACGLFSCKKTYICECKNSNTTYVAGEKEGTRNQAKKYCQDLSSGDTKCNIQQ